LLDFGDLFLGLGQGLNIHAVVGLYQNILERWPRTWRNTSNKIRLIEKNTVAAAAAAAYTCNNKIKIWFSGHTSYMLCKRRLSF
jgi:hypothetical protein